MKNLLVLFGGKSNEHEISLLSASNVCSSADADKYNIIKIGITKDGSWWLYTGDNSKIADGSWESDKANLTPAIISPCTAHHGIVLFNKSSHTYEIKHIDAAFPVLHGSNGEDGTMQGLLTVAGIPFVGCDTYSSAVCMNKTAAKILSATRDVASTPFVTVKNYEKDSALDSVRKTLSYPVFVKPQSSGSSVGITKVKSESELLAALEIAFASDIDATALVEQAVVGKEIEVAIIGRSDNLFTSVCGEIEPGREFYDYENKYKEDTAKYYAPARIDEATSDKVRAAAADVFKACGCLGLARCDFFVTESGEVLFNEINTIPGFTQISMYSKLLILSGMTMSGIIDELVELALTRYKVVHPL
ncbi:MAG: D-alanine--D-alanine ligase [Eubacteriales bacterium]|nr:D-alanine--D-alanine ligase [Eubacteriales bacterium]MDD4474190.1 D-alanine--D-alanine ligase [Eubacteriales bacterium]